MYIRDYRPSLNCFLLAKYCSVPARSKLANILNRSCKKRECVISFCQFLVFIILIHFSIYIYTSSVLRCCLTYCFILNANNSKTLPV